MVGPLIVQDWRVATAQNEFVNHCLELLGKKDEYLECMKQIYEVDYGYRDVAKRVESSYGG